MDRSKKIENVHFNITCHSRSINEIFRTWPQNFFQTSLGSLKTISWDSFKSSNSLSSRLARVPIEFLPWGFGTDRDSLLAQSRWPLNVFLHFQNNEYVTLRRVHPWWYWWQCNSQSAMPCCSVTCIITWKWPFGPMKLQRCYSPL